MCPMSELPQNQKDKKKSKYSGPQKYIRYSGMAFEMVAIILIAVWGGLKLDEKFNKGNPLFIVIFSILGVFIALYTALHDFIKFKK